MPTADSQLIITCVVVYLASCAVIGVWAMRRTSSAADFFLAGKSLGPVVVVMATISSVMSGFGFVGGPRPSLRIRLELALDGVRIGLQPAGGFPANRQALAPARRSARHPYVAGSHRGSLRGHVAGAGDERRYISGRHRIPRHANPCHRHGAAGRLGHRSAGGPEHRAGSACLLFHRGRDRSRRLHGSVPRPADAGRGHRGAAAVPQGGRGHAVDQPDAVGHGTGLLRAVGLAGRHGRP